jgi:hypothetical protein
VSLVPNALQLIVAVSSSPLERTSVFKWQERVVSLGIVSLPFTLWCVAKLLTHGASPRRGEDQAALAHANKIDFVRVLELAVALGLPFLAVGFIGLLLTYLAGLKGLAITFGLAYWAALSLANVLLHFWGFEPNRSNDDRRIASAAFGFLVACWVSIVLTL